MQSALPGPRTSSSRSGLPHDSGALQPGQCEVQRKQSRGRARSEVRTIIIDNYDSYTYNLFQLIAEVNDEEPVVITNDELSWRELSRLGCDNMVISPGPAQSGRSDRQHKLKR